VQYQLHAVRRALVPLPDALFLREQHDAVTIG